MIKKKYLCNKNFFLIISLIFSLMFLTLKTVKADTSRQETYKQLNLFGDVFQRVQEQYVEEVTDKKLIESPFIPIIKSPDFIPAFAAGVSSIGETTFTTPSSIVISIPKPPKVPLVFTCMSL